MSHFYPFQILVWHEIVNDTINDKRVLVTYCPLCLSGIVFDPVVAGERVEFGTSGKLWNSNLVMYDRKTDSLWSQIFGEAIAGEMTGLRLEVLPSDQIRFGEWRTPYFLKPFTSSIAERFLSNQATREGGYRIGYYIVSSFLDAHPEITLRDFSILWYDAIRKFSHRFFKKNISVKIN